MSEIQHPRRGIRKELFERYCMQPGTRMARILSAIANGEDILAIAKKFKTDAPTIRVYEKVWLNDLTPPSGKADDTSDHYRVWWKAQFDPGGIELTGAQSRVGFDRDAAFALIQQAGYAIPDAMKRCGMSPRYLSKASNNGFISLKAVLKIKSELGVDLFAGGAAWFGNVPE